MLQTKGGNVLEKGKFTQEYRDYINSEDWEAIRKAKLRESGYECERCGSRKGLQVHHRHYDKEFGYEDDEDLMVLCYDCHDDMHD